MNLIEMRTIVRRDLHDEDSSNYRWTNDEIDRHIAHAVIEFSGAVPLEQKAALNTVAGSRAVDISSITNCVMLEALEYPVGLIPAYCRRFSVWDNTLYLLDDIAPDGSKCNIFYGTLHILDAQGSTIPAQFDEIVAAGAAGYAAIEWAVFSINKANAGGITVPGDFMSWGEQKLAYFRETLKKLSKVNRVRVRSLYLPYYPPVSKTTDYGP